MIYDTRAELMGSSCSYSDTRSIKESYSYNSQRCRKETYRYHHILNAREWLSSNSDDFRHTCHLAGLEPEYVQRKWTMLQQGGLDAKKYFTDRTY